MPYPIGSKPMSRNLWAFSNSIQTRPCRWHVKNHVKCRPNCPSNERWVTLLLLSSILIRIDLLSSRMIVFLYVCLLNMYVYNFFFLLFCLIVETILFRRPLLQILHIPASLSLDSFVLHLFFHSAMCAPTFVFLCLCVCVSVCMRLVFLTANNESSFFFFLFLRMWN